MKFFEPFSSKLNEFLRGFQTDQPMFPYLVETLEKLLRIFTAMQGVIQKIFLGGGSMKKCDHDCDQALMKSSWESV